MAQTRTGRMRLRGGLATGWTLAHKTGSGQILNGVQAGYNDIGILTSPEGRHYAVAVMIRRTATPNLTRMPLMQNVTRAVIAYDESLGGRGNRPPRPADDEADDVETEGKTY
jgi:beta-lactamase class A